MGNSRAAKITLTVIAKLEPGEMVRDTEIKGFGVRRQLDAITYFVRARVQGRGRWFTVGEHGKGWTPELARKEAKRILGDPVAATKVVVVDTSFQEAAEQFIATHGKKLKARTLAEYDRQVRLMLIPAFGKLSMTAIRRGDVARAHTKWSDTPRMANHALAVLSKIMSWAEDQGYRDEGTNPCRKVEKYRESKRERYLKPDELLALGEALRKAEAEGLASAFAIAAIRLLILTGGRRSEILTLMWAHVDFERRLLLLPDSKTGGKTIRLNDASIEVLKSLPRFEGNPYVLVGKRNGKPMVDIQKPWEDVRTLAGIKDVRLHDLRHTFASVAVGAGGSLPMIGRMLGHSQSQTTARYTHLSDDPVEKLTEATGRVLAQALAGRPVVNGESGKQP